jgi:hypothetical protein
MQLVYHINFRFPQLTAKFIKNRIYTESRDLDFNQYQEACNDRWW